MAHKPISSFTAGRPLRLNGTAFAIGDVVPWAALMACKGIRISALVARRFLIPDVDSHGRRTRTSTPRPADVPASVIAKFRA